jgi:hypothetical protein
LTLKLRSCRINDDGCEHLIDALRINSSVRFLDIEGNDLSPASIYTALVRCFLVVSLRVDPGVCIFVPLDTLGSDYVVIVSTYVRVSLLWLLCFPLRAQAEVQAVNDTDALKANPMAVDAGALSVYVSPHSSTLCCGGLHFLIACAHMTSAQSLLY